MGERHVDAVRGKLVHQSLQRGDESKIIERRRMQPMGQTVDFRADLGGALAQLAECARHGGGRTGVGAELVDADRQYAEHLADMVVQLPSDAAAFLLLGVNEPAGELLELPFGATS